jgi:transketolase
VQEEDFLFLTGDLGFNALEDLQKALGARFINAGVAEQNMIGVAAGLASKGYRPWAYSIAPFIYARPFEHIRNNICLQWFPVTLVGNGGGFGYGVMGPTHHAIEDYGVLSTLGGMKCFVPAFDEDLSPIIKKIGTLDGPAYLRLGRSECSLESATQPYRAVRCLLEGPGATIVAVGPIAGGLLLAARGVPQHLRPSIWVVSELPLLSLMSEPELLASLADSEHLIIVEEHVEAGSLGQAIAASLLKLGKAPRKFEHLCARGYVTGRYGSQQFHRRENGIEPNDLIARISL